MRPEETIKRAKASRKEMTAPEKALWKILRDRRLQDYKFRRQHPIGAFVTDFACPAQNLVVEVDGLSHLSTEQKHFDAERTKVLNTKGWRVHRVKNADVLQDPNKVTASILEALRDG